MRESHFRAPHPAQCVPSSCSTFSQFQQRGLLMVATPVCLPLDRSKIKLVLAKLALNTKYRVTYFVPAMTGHRLAIRMNHNDMRTIPIRGGLAVVVAAFFELRHVADLEQTHWLTPAAVRNAFAIATASASRASASVANCLTLSPSIGNSLKMIGGSS